MSGTFDFLKKLHRGQHADARIQPMTTPMVNRRQTEALPNAAAGRTRGLNHPPTYTEHDSPVSVFQSRQEFTKPAIL